jgi:AAA family ATP:ADP antiporter
MMLILFLICFDYNLLRTVKDAVIVPVAGAEVIPFLKVWGILPGALLITFLYARLSNRFSQESIFYIMVTGFLIFFSLFAFVCYPMRDVVHFDSLADTLTNYLPAGAKGFIGMVRYWSFSAFYILAELWGSMVMTVMFWGFANEIMKLDEAKRFYGLLGVSANFSSIIAGIVGIYCSKGILNTLLPFGNSSWEQTLMLSTLIVIVTAIMAMGIFRWMNRITLASSAYQDVHTVMEQGSKKKPISLGESIAFLSRSSYLICIAVIVIGYNLTMNLVEVVWKDQLRQLYPSEVQYNAFMSYSIIWVGLICTVGGLLVRLMLNRFGWTTTALITPVIMLVTCAGFFSFYFFQDNLSGIAFALFGASPLAIAVLFGAAQNILSRASKYTVFDATKEMTFIPLDHEMKLKGKTAIDGVGSRFGKSGGSLIYQGLLMFFGNVAASAPYVAAILFASIILWIGAARALGKKFNQLTAGKDEEAQQQTTPAESPIESSELATLSQNACRA